MTPSGVISRASARPAFAALLHCMAGESPNAAWSSRKSTPAQIVERPPWSAPKVRIGDLPPQPGHRQRPPTVDLMEANPTFRPRRYTIRAMASVRSVQATSFPNMLVQQIGAADDQHTAGGSTGLSLTFQRLVQ